MSEKNDIDPEKGSSSQQHPSPRPPYWRIVFQQAVLTPEIISYKYHGSGSEEDPYIVDYIPNDPANPMTFSGPMRWSLTMLVAFATLAVAFVSSAYAGGAAQILKEFHTSSEVVTLGLSLFVLGFAIGPLFWAPLSELYGRQRLFIVSYCGLTAFNAGAAFAPNIQTLLILRFWAGAFGSSPLTNAGGVIADIFPASKRGLAMSVFAAAPFMGPTLGPVVGGFLGDAKGWRWVEGLLAIFSGVLWILMIFLLPETYTPVLLRQRAKRLTNASPNNKIYKSKLEAHQRTISLTEAFRTALSRPWILLFREPIVLLLSIYMAIIYGTLYMLFGAFPVVYQQQRGWSSGIGGLAFLGVAAGMLVGVGYNLIDNNRYARISKEYNGFAPPEARLPPVLVGCVCIPIGIFWFAWTNGKSVHWIVSILAGVPFGAGMVLVFLGSMNYLIDAYTVFAASVLAANSVLRSLFGAAFPMFTKVMYENLGIHWASSIPAFLALACVPAPFLFYKYGAAIRERCKFAKEAAEIMLKIRSGSDGKHEKESKEGTNDELKKEIGPAADTSEDTTRNEDEEIEDPETLNPFDIERVYSNNSFASQSKPKLEKVKSKNSLRGGIWSRGQTYGQELKPVDTTK